MLINGLSLPSRFVDCLENGRFHREVGSWPLTAEDSYGNPLESELGTAHASEAAIIHETARLPNQFRPDGVYGEASDWAGQPGFIPDIVDFSKIVCFGDSGDGAPFCLDYRDQGGPSIIWWDDAYWRRIAPDFDAFIKLISE